MTKAFMITVIYGGKMSSYEPSDLWPVWRPQIFFFFFCHCCYVNIALVNTFSILTHDYVWISQWSHVRGLLADNEWENVMTSAWNSDYNPDVLVYSCGVACSSLWFSLQFTHSARFPAFWPMHSGRWSSPSWPRIRNKWRKELNEFQSLHLILFPACWLRRASSKNHKKIWHFRKYACLFSFIES